MQMLPSHSFSKKVFRRIGKIVLDSVAIFTATILAILVQFANIVPTEIWSSALTWAAASTITNMMLLIGVGEYFRIWRFTGVRELQRITGAVLLNALLWWQIYPRLAGVLPVTIFVIAAAFALFGLLAIRVSRRQLDGTSQRNRVYDRESSTAENLPAIDRERVLLVGAGKEADSLLAELVAKGRAGPKIVGILDDEVALTGERLRGIPILGTTAHLEAAIREASVSHVIIAAPRLSPISIRQLISLAQSAGASVRALPRIRSIANADLEIQHPVTLNDLIDSAEIKRSLLPSVSKNARKPKILVTGGAGYIGSHLVRRLLERGEHVRILDNFVYGDSGLQGLMQHPNLEIRRGDITELRSIVGAVKDVESVISLAAIVGDPACGLNAEETLTLNYEATKVLIEACTFYGVTRLLFTSSCSVYGASHDEMLDENSQLNPVSLYARTRILSEQVLRQRCGDVNTTIVRLATVFGLSQRMRFDLVVNTLTARAVVDRGVRIIGGDQWRPFVHCDDVAAALIALVDAPSESVSGETFNLGSTDMNFTLSDVGQIVASRVGPDVEIFTEDFVDDRRNYRVCFDKLAKATGWKKTHTLESGIDEMVEALMSNPNLRSYNQAVFSNLQYFRQHLTSVGRLPV